MHVQRVHYGKLCLLLGALAGLLLLVYTHTPDPRNLTIDVEVEERVEVEAARSAEDALGVARLHSCPACLGRGLCQEVSQGWLAVSVFGSVVPGGVEYRGSMREEEWGLAVTVPEDGAWETWDAAVCANATQPRGCLVAEAATSSFLFRGRADGPGLRKLHRLTGEPSPPPLTACATAELAHGLADAFDENRDSRLSAEERAMLVTTVGVAPSVAALRLATNTRLTGVPALLGACGRLVVTEGGLTPLNHYRTTSWDTRRDLGGQVLSLLEGLMSPASPWLWVVWSLDIHSFAVTKTGQVVLSSLASVTPIPRSLLAPPPQEERPACNLQCFMDWKHQVMMATPRGQPGKGCAAAGQYTDIAYSLACSSVLGGAHGLLASGGEEVAELLARCAQEDGPGDRWRAVDELMELLGGESEASGEDDGGEEEEEGEEGEEEDEEDDGEEADVEDDEGEEDKREAENSDEEEIYEEEEVHSKKTKKGKVEETIDEEDEVEDEERDEESEES